MAIRDVVERVGREPPYEPETSVLPGAHVCTVLEPVPWDKAELEGAFGMPIPDELTQLWHQCDGMRLFEDRIDGQWGLIVHGPKESLVKQEEFLRDRGEWGLPGDLVFASFRGDQEVALLRCDKAASDYGSVVIVAEMDERSLWEKAADSLEAFLRRFLDTKGDKYWEQRYEAVKADREAVRRLKEPLGQNRPLNDDEVERLLDAGFTLGFKVASDAPMLPRWVLLGKVHPALDWLKEHDGKGDDEVPAYIVKERQLLRAPYFVKTVELRRVVQGATERASKGDIAHEACEWFPSLTTLKAHLSAMGYSMELAKEARSLGVPRGV